MHLTASRLPSKCAEWDSNPRQTASKAASSSRWDTDAWKILSNPTFTYLPGEKWIWRDSNPLQSAVHCRLSLTLYQSNPLRTDERTRTSDCLRVKEMP